VTRHAASPSPRPSPPQAGERVHSAHAAASCHNRRRTATRISHRHLVGADLRVRPPSPCLDPRPPRPSLVGPPHVASPGPGL
jgi:hypothetical protein